MTVDADRMAAFNKARKLFGDGAVVGTDPQQQDRKYVGKRAVGVPDPKGRGWLSGWLLYGEGETWDEAFADVRPCLFGDHRRRVPPPKAP